MLVGLEMLVVRLRDTLLTATYVVVAFSVLVQGLTLGRLARE